MKNKFYVTTTIPYANAPPHIGFALEIVQADVLARWNKIKGKDVFFLTGTDEHGTKNYQTAKAQGLKTQKFVDKNSFEFKNLTKSLNISNDYFIRTTDKKVHWPGVVEMWKKLEKKGDIYKKSYVGNYCSGCERFITEKELLDGKCQTHFNLKIQKLSEENYFFRLSKYSDKIKKLIESDKLKISPKKYKKSFLSLAEDGLTDVSFSRDVKNLPWGIPVPRDKNQVMYVWCDALTNYLTGIGYPDKKYKKFWPADVHVVGKDMLRFHAGIWPGMLLSAGLPLPKEIIVHGFLTVDGKKMSKSLGNVISPLKLREKYESDSIRYFLLRENPFGNDGDFSEKALISRHNNELADKLGNLVSRVSNLIEKNGLAPNQVPSRSVGGLEEGIYPKGTRTSSRPRDISGEMSTRGKNKLLKKLDIGEIENKMDNYEFDKVLNEIFSFVDSCNEYVQKNKIWETKDKKKLYELKESILKISELLWPFIPETSEKIKKQFSAKKIKKSNILFKKI
jgi:methionyl-tRNA synthetase